MKKLLLIILLFLSFPCLAQNLPTQEKLFEGCTVIIVETTDKATAAFKKVQSAFKDQGFTILSIDKDIFTLMGSQTLEGAADMKINASINQAGTTQIILNGSLANGAPPATSTGSKIANIGNSNSISRKAFDKMHQVALSYKGAKILYGTD